MRDLIACFCFIALALLAYGNSFHIPFFSDDITNITSRAQLLGHGGLFDALTSISPDRPLQTLSFWLVFKLSGLNPVGYRVTGAILFGLLGFAVYQLYALFATLHLKARTTRGPALLALFWLLTPVHNQAVILISQRGALFCALFSVLSITSFLRYAKAGKNIDLLLSYLWFVLGLLSKGTAIAVLPILALYAAMYRRALIREARVFIPYLAAGLLPFVFYFAMRINVQASSLSPLEYLSVQSRVLFIYFRLFFWPFDLRYSYDISLDPAPLLNLTWLAIAGHLAILGLACAALKRRPAISLAVLSTYLAFAPESSVLPIDHVIWEYRTCFPFIFLFGLFGLFAMAGAASIRKRKAPAWLTWLPCALLPVLVAANYARTDELSTPERWVHDTISKNKHDHSFNLKILTDLYYLGNDAEGARLSEELAEANPGIGSYGFLRSMFRYRLDPKKSDTRLLESLAATLRSPDVELPKPVRTALDVFIIDELPHFLSQPALDVKIEDLLFPQIARWGAQAFNSNGLFKMYNVVLNRLLDLYEAKQKSGHLEVIERARRLKLLAAREVFFGVKADGLEESFKSFLARHPEAVLTARIHQWYLASH